jgi:hypothetical protein
MTPSLTIAYVTGRKEPKFLWFYLSLQKQLGKGEQPQIIFVSRDPTLKNHTSNLNDHILAVPPKPNVWQGEHRLTKQDWWAMSNARNTALCLCRTDYIAYVDDLSVLMPGWLDAVKEAMTGNYIACGAYKKVKNLKVENGEVISYDEFPEGVDHRLALTNQDVTGCTPGWLFGCSCLFHTEALLQVGGWPEYVDGLGAEDYILGFALKNNGYDLRYCKKMMTLESEELHHTDQIKKTDKGISPNDKSNAALRIAQQTKYFDNYYEGGMRALRDYVLAGNPFPIVRIPDRDWYDQQLLSEM